MTYDQWKTTDPNDRSYYDDYEDEDPCDHEDAETDCLDGRVVCHRCGAQWYASADELAAEHRRLVEYHDWEERENRRQWWRDRTYPVRMFVFRVLERMWPRQAISVLHDDEIPF